MPFDAGVKDHSSEFPTYRLARPSAFSTTGGALGAAIGSGIGEGIGQGKNLPILLGGLAGAGVGALGGYTSAKIQNHMTRRRIAKDVKEFEARHKEAHEKDYKKAPISFRAGAAVGRHTDVLPAILGTLSGAGLGMAATHSRLGAIPGAVLGGLAGRASGRFAQGMASGAAHAYPVKEAGVMREKGVRRGIQLLTGSRARSIAHGAAEHNAQAQNSFKQYFATGAGHHEKEFMEHHMATRAARAAEEAERGAVSRARKDTAGVVGTLGLGTGAGLAATRQKEATVVDALAKTVAPGSKKIRAVTEAVQSQVAKHTHPLLTGKQKLLGGALVTGVGAGALVGHEHHKTAELSAERVEQIKEAFGAALMQGIKGIGQFASVAGKSIAGAARAGGAAAAGQAAMNAGRSGLMRAGGFIAKNPAAGAALVAAPALAAGYAAGRQ